MHPRTVALGIVTRGGYALVEEYCGEHSQGNGTYYRPLGGTIEFGERSADTVVREFREELGAEVTVVRYKDPLPVTEGQRIGVARWIKVEELLSGGRVLYPTGVSEVLARMVREPEH